MAKGMKSYPNVRSVYDRALSWMGIVIACAVIIEACYTKSIWVRSRMKTFAKVRKLSLVITISIHLCVWQRKRWKTFIYTWDPLFNAIVVMYLKVYHGLQCTHSRMGNRANGHPNHQCYDHIGICERCTTIRCGIPRWIHSVVRKWAEDKQNKRLGRINNQAPNAKPAQEWRCARTTSKRTYAKSEVNSYSCSWSIKEDYISI